MSQSTTPAQRIEELERELKTRLRVYPGWIRDEKLTHSVADHRIQVIRGALDDLRRLYPQPVQAALFTPEQLPPPKPAAHYAEDRPRDAFRS